MARIYNEVISDNINNIIVDLAIGEVFEAYDRNGQKIMEVDEANGNVKLYGQLIEGADL